MKSATELNLSII